MITALKTMLTEWNTRYSERVKLQHAYIVLSLLGIIIAGLVGLLNYDASRTILRICFFGLGIFFVNAIAWALVYGLVVTKLPIRPVPASRK
ncbi:MAG TPA: hypothetical protein VLF43_00600 [Candidatus Saccharimonadales bacterium]|nr:hypothetical protein [Candidatus Saccharimonadales bacterium]